ncbi:MAG: acylphosphatase [Anaerosomatales bacterium]|nr:acylphosphatase [Anaerosomatales bacterium]
MSEQITRRRVSVSGVVQGVFFRASTRDMAVRLGLAGWVRNTTDGGVEAVFEGEPDAVEQAVAWMRHGPERAVVERIDVSAEEPQGGHGFRIAY